LHLYPLSHYVAPTLTLRCSLLFFQCNPHHRHLHSFPTRRSSDLARRRAAGADAPGAEGGAARLRLVDAASRGRRGRRQRRLPHRSEEHTSELQSRGHLVCRLLLEKKNATSAWSCPDPVVG